jgi:hypothetical protein
MRHRLVGGAIGLLILLLGAVGWLQSRDGDEAEGRSNPGRKVLRREAATSEAPATDAIANAPLQVGVEAPGDDSQYEFDLRTERALEKANIESLLKVRGRTPGNLVLAALALGEMDYLMEAAESHPDSPLVQLYIAVKIKDPEVRQKAIGLLWKLDNSNTIIRMLSAADSFAAGYNDAAYHELPDSDVGFFGNVLGMKDYRAELQASVEDAYRNAGFPESDAKLGGLFFNYSGPWLESFEKTTGRLTKLTREYKEAGNGERARGGAQKLIAAAETYQRSASTAMEMGAALEVEYRTRTQLISNDPANEKKVKELVEQLTANEGLGLGGNNQQLLFQLNAEQLGEFMRIKDTAGERVAIAWMKEQPRD